MPIVYCFNWNLEVGAWYNIAHDVVRFQIKVTYITILLVVESNWTYLISNYRLFRGTCEISYKGNVNVHQDISASVVVEEYLNLSHDEGTMILQFFQEYLWFLKNSILYWAMKVLKGLKPVLIPIFRSVKRMRVFDSP